MCRGLHPSRLVTRAPASRRLAATARRKVAAAPQVQRLLREVRAACAAYGHTIEQCATQLAEMREPVYDYIPHPALSRRNMLLMNALGVAVTDNSADRPGHRTPTVQAPTMPQPGYAEHVVDTITMVDLPLQL